MANSTLLGSKNNPYKKDAYSQLLSTNSWKGGWVEMSLKEIVYITETNASFNENIDVFGSYYNPIPEIVKEEMVGNNIWEGGWIIGENSVRKYYYTFSKEIVETDSNGQFTSEHPCESEFFFEMCSNSMWIGGYVRFPNGDIEYYSSLNVEITLSSGCSGSQGNNGSGSGSGSGSGNSSGCGCGSGSDGDPVYEIEGGSLILGAFRSLAGTLTAKWTSGVTTGYCPEGKSYASVYAIIELKEPGTMLERTCFNGEWTDTYTYSFSGYFDFTMNNKTWRVDIGSVTFSIPHEYRE